MKKEKKTSRVNTGNPTNDLVRSAYVASNDEVFPKILQLYVTTGARIADVTYGKGVFWKKIDKSKYKCFFSDIKGKDGKNQYIGKIDSRNLPYRDGFFDAVVFDPPYMHTPGGTAHNGHQNYEQYYANNVVQNDKQVEKQPKYHEAVLDLYFKSAKEAYRILKNNGIYIVKCQDEVCSNKQRLTHIEITIELLKLGYIVEDLFVIIRKNKPGVSRIKTRQYHARKNHSYFMVYRKK